MRCCCRSRAGTSSSASISQNKGVQRALHAQLIAWTALGRLPKTLTVLAYGGTRRCCARQPWASLAPRGRFQKTSNMSRKLFCRRAWCGILTLLGVWPGRAGVQRCAQVLLTLASLAQRGQHLRPS